jgi:hypothetical protein
MPQLRNPPNIDDLRRFVCKMGADDLLEAKSDNGAIDAIFDYDTAWVFALVLWRQVHQDMRYTKMLPRWVMAYKGKIPELLQKVLIAELKTIETEVYRLIDGLRCGDEQPLLED